MVRKMECKFSGLMSFQYPLKCSFLPAKIYEKPPQGTKITVPPLQTTVPPPIIVYARELVDNLSPLSVPTQIGLISLLFNHLRLALYKPSGCYSTCTRADAAAGWPSLYSSRQWHGSSPGCGKADPHPDL